MKCEVFASEVISIKFSRRLEECSRTEVARCRLSWATKTKVSLDCVIFFTDTRLLAKCRLFFDVTRAELEVQGRFIPISPSPETTFGFENVRK